MQREFLSWRRPALEGASDYLWRRYACAPDGRPLPVWDLSTVILALPGGRAGRMLGERLVVRAEQQPVPFFPPQMTTVGRLPELLYACRRPFASELVQQAAWAQVLRAADERTLQDFLAEIPAAGDDSRWWELACLLARQHAELAGDGLDFASVATAGRQLPAFAAGERRSGTPSPDDAASWESVDEVRRWESLARIQQAYLRRLDELGLWDLQTARLYAIEHQECQTNGDIILIGAVDMNRAVRRMLEQVSGRVTALVYADAGWADRFDALGCVLPEKWQGLELPLRDEDLVQVDNEADQARAVVQQLAGFGGRYAAEQITVGVPDESLVPTIQRALADAMVPARYGPGRSIESTRPVRLLRALADYLISRRVGALQDLVRHPDLAICFAASTSPTSSRPSLVAAHWTAQLDWLASEHLPQSADELRGLLEQELARDASAAQASSPVTPSPVTPQSDDAAMQIRSFVRQWDELERAWEGLGTGGGTEKRPPTEWIESVLALLVQIYGNARLRPYDAADRLVLEGCQAIREGLLALQTLPSEMVQEVTAGEAILMALGMTQGRQVAAIGQGGAVELLGWLELPLDDAPVLLLTGLNEGQVPTSANSDLFLPNQLRSQLGLDDNARRYARDAYSLTVLTKSREQVRWILARRDREGNPLLPSRLLFSTSDELRIKRCLRLFGEQELEPPRTELPRTELPRTELPRTELPRTEPKKADSSGSLREAGTESLIATARPVPDRHRFLVRRPPTGSDKVDVLNVTDFRSYLECPFRFYLTRVLRLRSIAEPPAELDGAAFGSRMHEILELFGSSPTRDSADASPIEAFLLDSLSDVFVRHYGPHPRPTVRLQRAQLELRLRAFARTQAAWRQEGWEIYLTEAETRSVTASWCVDGAEITLRGRLDRIDYHPRRGEYAVLDYKTSDGGDPPEKTHQRGRGEPSHPAAWRDLQLPLYRHLTQNWDLPRDKIKLGYVTLPKSSEQTRFRLADWTASHLDAADAAAEEVVRRIRAGQFWPPQELPAGFDEGLDRICQASVFDRCWDQAEPDSDSDSESESALGGQAASATQQAADQRSSRSGQRQQEKLR
jgi:hypothetical protein